MVAGSARDFAAVLSGARNLLVEENEINQQVARELLEQLNVTVILAQNGREAVERVASESLDGVLMDLQMPVMDGLTATREIRKDARFAALPILAMTANAMSGDREQCLEAGMQDHIAKPVNPDEMYATLARWIKPASPQPVPARERPLEAEREAGGVPEIPGLDTQAGLSRMGGNLPGYLALLAKFRVNQGGAAQAVAEALSAADWPTAERLAHTLKGVAGAIGAAALEEKAKRLETLLRERGDLAQVEGVRQETAVELAAVCARLDQALPPPSVGEGQAAVVAEGGEEVERRDQLLREAARQLAIFDAAVEKTLVDLRGIALSRESLDWVGQLEKQVANYDFEGAAATLVECAAALKVDLEGSGG